MKPCIMVIEDDQILQKLFVKTLQDDGYRTLAAESTEAALNLLHSKQADLVLSDVVFQGSDGITFCRELRTHATSAEIPCILVSGRRIEENDQIEGLVAGADDYLLKPVSSGLLLAKIQSVLRRFQAPRTLASVLEPLGISLDVRARRVLVNGRGVALTRKEFDLLTNLMHQPHRVLTERYLLERVWGMDPNAGVTTRTLTVHVSSLRNKLGDPLASRIVNIPRVGYRFDL